MTEALASVKLPDTTRLLLPEVRRRLPRVAKHITKAVQEAVPEYGGATDGRRHHLIYTAVHTAARYFIDSTLGEPVSPTAVEDLYRKMGFRTAAVGEDLDALESALSVASRACWDEVRVTAAERGVPPHALENLHQALEDYVAHLTSKVRAAHAEGLLVRDQDSGLALRRLAANLLGGADHADILDSAAQAEWSIPEELVVIAVEVGNEPFDPAAFEPAALCRTRVRHATLLVPIEEADGIVEQLKATLPTAWAARCWPVPVADLPSAHRWAQRALRLVKRGVIPARAVIDCTEHRTEIWLHAEPTLRRQLAQELLKPLFAETPNSQEILSETLLVWLETRDSAPAIAARLGVHPQTVRYRWKRINELFGEDLQDPDFVMQLTLLLKASVPLWVAGDMSDFERHREQEE